MNRRELMKASLAGVLVSSGTLSARPSFAASKEGVDRATAKDNVFWRLVGKGVEASCKQQGYSYTILA